ncbi:MAG TPA: mannitol dehydrogenase family protein [Jiangellaceae bacterium]
MAPRLSRATLGRVPDGSGPLVRPWDVRPGIVHLGVGAFHRAHQAVYTESALAGGGDWGIVGVAPRRRAVVDGLAAQDGLFSVTSLDGNGSGTRVVGSIVGVRHLPSDPAGVIDLIADPAIRIVTLTVTEKGYLLDPATGRLMVDDGLRAELTGAAPPWSIPGLLIAGLRARAGRGAGPLALVSCDNLPSNGRRLRQAVLDAYSAAGADAGWVEANVTFPGTMVDRVVPATTAETIAAAAAALNVRDEMAVAAEPYSEWVVEDEFPGGRPAWQAVGAVLTSDARPYERLKLRALNGVHSALAYLGALAGCPTIADALALPGMRPMLERFIADDIAPSLTPPPGRSVIEYGKAVLDRFANPAIGHRTLQVAMDGSQKMPQRILHTAADRLAANAEPRWAALVTAAWMCFVAGYADDGRELPLDDPLATRLRRAARSAAPIDALLAIDAVFAPDLAADEGFGRLVARWFSELGKYGVADVLAGLKEEA